MPRPAPSSTAAQEDEDSRNLRSTDLKAFCEGSLTHVTHPGRLDLNISTPLKSLVCALFPFGWLFEPSKDEPAYSQGGQVFVFSPHCDTRSISGLVVSRAEGKWRAWPHSIARSDITEYGCCFSVSCDWISVLHEIAATEISAVERFQDNLNMQLTSFGSEIFARTNSFRYKLKQSLFRNVGEFLAWNVALSWDEWETQLLPNSKRAEELHQMTNIEMEASAIEAFAPSTVISAFRRLCRIPDSHSTDSYLTGLEVAVELSHRPYALSEMMDENGSVEYYPAQSDGPEFFSFGGPPELAFPFRPTTKHFALTSPAANESTLHDELWWWRGMPKWDNRAFEIFLDNFELSSFYYELRARCSPVRRWDPFGLPWVKLSNFKRGVLNCLWPTKRYGQHTFIYDQFPSEFRAGTNQILIPLDLRASQADVIKKVVEIHRRERIKRNFPDPGGRRKKEESPTWEVIELLDRKYFFNQQIKASERRLIETVVNRYRLDCAHAGLVAEP